MIPWSIPDLSDITNVLTGLLQTALNNANPSASNIKIYNNSPDSARTSDGYCHLTLYLLHVGRDPYWRNTPVSGPRAQPNSAQPLSLNLSYLLTAWHDTDFASEQRAMTLALQAFHSQPIVTPGVIQKDSLTQWLPNGEFTVSIEADTIEEMSRLWQAITVPIRLSALIRAGVVFIAPAALPQTVWPVPTVANLSVSPEPMSAPQPLLFAGGSVSVQPILPASAEPAQVVATNGPLTVVGGGSLAIAGNDLDQPVATQVFLRVPGGATAWDITSWRQPPLQAGQMVLALPTAYADPANVPTATPPPGLYDLSVGSVPLAAQSNAIPIVVAPRVDNMLNPPHLMADSTGLYTIKGAGFTAASTIVALGALPLVKAATPTPTAGQFAVDGTGTTITFFLPSPAPAKGTYPVLIQVNGIAAAPGWVVVVGP